MIYLIIGTNTYTVDDAIRKIQRSSGCSIERFDAVSLTINNLADIIRGGTLFAQKRLVIIGQLSENEIVWEKLGEWASGVSNDITLVLIEEKLDKRTKTYKFLTKASKIILADSWSEYESGKAEQWLLQYAKQHQVALSPTQCRNMVVRSLVVDPTLKKRIVNQQQLVQAVMTLQLCHGAITDGAIATVMPPAVADTIFDLLTAAAHKNTTKLSKILVELHDSADAYAIFAVVMGQWAQLVSVISTPTSSAGDLGIHPYAQKKLRELTPLFTQKEIATLTRVAKTMDAMAKRVAFSPWDNLERFLFEIASR